MDFDLFIDRKPTESLKWNCYPDDVLPLWVADTDFRCPPAVMEALHKRVDHGIFGYAARRARPGGHRPLQAPL